MRDFILTMIGVRGGSTNSLAQSLLVLPLQCAWKSVQNVCTLYQFTMYFRMSSSKNCCPASETSNQPWSCPGAQAKTCRGDACTLPVPFGKTLSTWSVLQSVAHAQCASLGLPATYSKHLPDRLLHLVGDGLFHELQKCTFPAFRHMATRAGRGQTLAGLSTAHLQTDKEA